jgi:hypothetical protein
MFHQQLSGRVPSASAFSDTVCAAARWMKARAARFLLLVVVCSFLFVAPAGCQREGEQLEPPSPPPVTPPPEGLNENPGAPQSVRPENLPEGR